MSEYPSSDDGQAFVELLVEAVPWWTETWHQHRADYGVQAPEAFLRTVAALTASRTFAGDAPDWEQFEQTLEFLESEFGADPAIDALIATSFLAKVPDPAMLGARVSSYLGPKLHVEFELQRLGKGFATPSTTSAFMMDLATAEPPVAAVLRMHMTDWGELLSHIFMDDLVRAAIVWLGTAEGRSSAVSMLAFLEDAYGQDYEVDELIATGFVENLPYPHDKGAAILTMLGPKLRGQYNIQRPSFRIGDTRA